MSTMLYKIIKKLEYYTTPIIRTLMQGEPKRVPIKVVCENDRRKAPYPPTRL